ncbi:MAG TPA: diacylglycerol kinase family protein [Actinomycetota bacterium]|nr:diacylglycerol kinase family protein [Actinomycetota bacterium]
MSGYLIVANPGAGSGDRSPAAEARRRLADARSLTLEQGVDLKAAIDEAVAEERIVVAAGGDGTIHAVAQHLVHRGTLGILPMGTVNNFARDLGVGRAEVALAALEDPRPRQIDVGRVGSRIFVNNLSVGLYPELVRHRERIEDDVGRWAAAAAAAYRVLRRGRPLTGIATADGDRRLLSAWVLFVGNNRFRASTTRPGVRDRLDEGVLDVRVITARPGSRRARAAWRILRGRDWPLRRQVRTPARRLQVILDDARAIAFDGEMGARAARFTVETVPGALRVLGAPDD